MSEAVDKLIASGSFNRDEIRELTGYEPIGSEEMQKFVRLGETPNPSV